LSEEKTEITSRTAGYSFHIKVERELRTQTEAKYPDKTVVSATLNGNDDSFAVMVEHAEKAKKTIDLLLTEAEQASESEKS